MLVRQQLLVLFRREQLGGLARCGFQPDANQVLARNRLWRMSQPEWLRVFEECLESPDESHLIRATVAFDFRHAAGGLEVVPPLVAVLRRASDYPDFIRQLARSASAFRPPLGFRGTLTVGRKDGERGRLDIKRGGQLPITNLARSSGGSGRLESGSLTNLGRCGKPKVAKWPAGPRAGWEFGLPKGWVGMP